MSFKTTASQRVHLYQIASEMKTFGLSDQFIADAVQLGEYYEGMYDLFEQWQDSDASERAEIVSDIQKEIYEAQGQPTKPQHKPSNLPTASFNKESALNEQAQQSNQNKLGDNEYAHISDAHILEQAQMQRTEALKTAMIILTAKTQRELENQGLLPIGRQEPVSSYTTDELIITARQLLDFVING